MPTIFIAVALLAAALAALGLLGGLLVLGGMVAIHSANERGLLSLAPADPRSVAPTKVLMPHSGERGSTAPKTQSNLGEDEARTDDPTTAYQVGQTAVSSYSIEGLTTDQRPTEMFGTNAGNFSELIDDDERR